jgi:hypothetical protein
MFARRPTARRRSRSQQSGREVIERGSSSSRNCSLRLGCPLRRPICGRYPRNPLNGSTSVMNTSLGDATRFSGRSSDAARAGRSWCGALATRLSKGSSMSCRRARPISRLARRVGRDRLLIGRISPGGEAMVVDDRRVRANRANAARSTGPRTKAGKAATRLNALRHGLAAAHNEPARSRRSRRSRSRSLATKRDLSCWPWRAGSRTPSWACAEFEARGPSSRIPNLLI